MIDRKKLANYYLESLRQSVLISGNAAKSPHLDIAYEEFREGHVAASKMNSLNASIVKKLKTQDSLDILITPVVIPVYNRVIFPIIIPATINASGQLEHEEYATPWIPRDLMSPVIEDSTVSSLYRPIADVSQYFEGIKGGAFNDLSWTDYVKQTEILFKDLTGKRISDFNTLEYTSGQQFHASMPKICRINLGGQITGMSFWIQRLYQVIIETKRSLPLLDSLNPEISSDQKDVSLSKSEIQTHYSHHLGQMTPKYGITATQRDALAYFDATSDGKTLAVSGPPGTGKTTLIQSVVATEWIKAAVKQTMPPICVASSVNNQAVTNIIRSFKSNTSDDSNLDSFYLPNTSTYQGARSNKAILASHWLPKHNTYGLYLVSADKLAESSKEFAAISRNNTDYLDQMIQADYLEQAKEEFLNKFSTVFPNHRHSLKQSQSSLHKLLQEVVEDIQTIASGQYVDNDSKIITLTTTLSSLEKELASSNNRLTAAEKFLADWLDYDNQQSGVLDYLPLIGPRRKAERKASYLHLKGKPANSNPETELDEERKTNERVKAQIDDAQSKLDAINTAKTTFMQACQRYNIDSDSVNGQIDTKLRYLAFLLATHYWEATWLLNVVQPKSATQPNDSFSKLRQQWQLRAMLTPCFVGTFYQVDAFFMDQKTPLFNAIDLLIADESGQVSPELAVASLALAKRFLAVGDTKQIQPIWSIQENVDEANMRNLGGFTESEAKVMKDNGFTVSTGDLMTLAQNQSAFTGDSESDSGLLLREHFRCLPQIMNYFNSLAYNGRLISMRKEPAATTEVHLPQMGYAHLFGHATSRNGSRYNQREADAIASWLSERKNKLLSLYNEHDQLLGKTVAIITPFKEQTIEIKKALTRQHLDEEEIIVGTVHALQGAERRIIIFSPVYDTASNSFFFDRGVNMLNVAVSRAKDSFLYFGNTDILSTNGTAPSSQLARQLFAHEENELRGASYFKASEVTTRLIGADKHDNWLIQHLLRASRQVDINSPYISGRSIKQGAKPLLAAIKRATEQGVQVNIYSSRGMYNKNSPHYIDQMDNFNLGVAFLQESGATVVDSPFRVHSKQVVIDGHILLDGSFNWFSAVRDESSQYYNTDTSTVVDDARLVKEFALPFMLESNVEKRVSKMN